eukprot:353227-Chlamydomonas_euryale.AAC.3
MPSPPPRTCRPAFSSASLSQPTPPPFLPLRPLSLFHCTTTPFFPPLFAAGLADEGRRTVVGHVQPAKNTELLEATKAVAVPYPCPLFPPPPAAAQVGAMKEGACLVSHIQPAKNTELLEALKAKKAVVVGMDTLPRQISRAQTFDSMSSQVGACGGGGSMRELAGGRVAVDRAYTAKVLRMYRACTVHASWPCL